MKIKYYATDRQISMMIQRSWIKFNEIEAKTKMKFQLNRTHAAVVYTRSSHVLFLIIINIMSFS